MPSDTSSSARTALRSLPYAFPVAVGLVCPVWSLTEFVAAFTDAYWAAAELFSPFEVLTVGVGFRCFGGVGALAVVVADR